MRTFATILLSFAALASAYRISVPNPSDGWTNVGSQPIEWVREPTDNVNFTVVLINTAYTQVLAALVDGNLGRSRVNPPSGGWTDGRGFQVLFVDSERNLTGILAQSERFAITSPTSTSSIASRTRNSGPTSVVNPTFTDIASNPVQTDGAFSFAGPAGLFKLCLAAAVVAFLA